MHREVLQKIAVSYLATLSSVGDFRARGPAFLGALMGWARPAAGGLSMGFYPIKCAFHLSFYEQSMGTVLLPFLLFLPSYLLEALRLRRQGLPFTAEQKVAYAVLVAFLLYPSVVDTILKVIPCHWPDVQGQRYLSADLSVHCYDGKHLAALVCSGAVLLGYALGLPALIFYLLKEKKSLGGFQFLLEGYDVERCPWWEAVVMLRKLVLQGVSVLLSDVFVQTSVASWVLLLALLLQGVYHPYSSAFMNRLDVAVLVVLFATQSLSSFYYTMDQQRSGCITGEGG